MRKKFCLSSHKSYITWECLRKKGIRSVFEAKREEATEEWKKGVREIFIIWTHYQSDKIKEGENFARRS